MLRLKLDDGLVGLVRKQIKDGNFSRDAYDIAICLHFFGRHYQLHRGKADLETYLLLLKDIKFMQVNELRSQHLEYMLAGLRSGVTFVKDEANLKIMKDFLPGFVNSIDADLHRY